MIFFLLGRRFQSEDEPWVKISDHEVCFETKGGKHGTLKYDGRSGMIGAMKLVHKSGFVRCHYKTVYSSKWGCAHFPGLERYCIKFCFCFKISHAILNLASTNAFKKQTPKPKHPSWVKRKISPKTLGLKYRLPCLQRLVNNYTPKLKWTVVEYSPTCETWMWIF